MNNTENDSSIDIMGLWSPFYEGVYKGKTYCLNEGSNLSIWSYVRELQVKMEHSDAYLRFINKIKSRKLEARFDGYYTDLFTNSYDWEREELEQLVWDRYCNCNDLYVICFLAQLKGIDVIPKIKTDLLNTNIPSEKSLNLAITLYNMVKDSKYLEIIEENVMADPDELSFVPGMFELKLDNDVYSLFKRIYIHCPNDINRWSAVTGMLYCKNIISNPKSISETQKANEYESIFDKETADERKKAIDFFEAELN